MSDPVIVTGARTRRSTSDRRASTGSIPRRVVGERTGLVLGLLLALVVGMTGCEAGGSDDGSDTAEAIGDEVFAAMTQGAEPTAKGGYTRTPLPMAERCAPTHEEPWRGRRSWDLAGGVLPQQALFSAALAHLEGDGWVVRRYHKPRSGVLGLTAQRDDGNEALDLIVSTNGATSLFVDVGPCAAADLELDPPWVEGAPAG